ncbi:MAG: DMT family transporter, partial [Clostridia bacterium]|nr:DMT family transporter [Clostridia bacterium]
MEPFENKNSIKPSENTAKNKNGHTMYAMNDAWKGVCLIVLSAFFYSLMSLFVRLAGDLPTFQKSFFRNLVAAIVGFALLLKSRSLKIEKSSLPALIGRTIAGTVGILCNFYAIDAMNISDASILNKLAPFFSILFSILILKEKSTWKDLLLVAVAFSGALFVVKPSFQLEKSLPALIGVLGGLGAGLAYTFVRYLGKKGER